MSEAPGERASCSKPSSRHGLDRARDRIWHPIGSGPGRIGVLLLNLGTPEATSYWPMRRYLKEFLSDRRVIEVPRLKWWPILNLVILTVRPSRKGKDYEKIWNRDRDESPLKTITRAQSEKLAAALGAPAVVVDWAMRYGNPATAAAITRLQAQGCEKLLLVPLYPQYAAATTASACDQAFRALMQLRWQPAVRVVPPYYAEPAYIDALAQSLRQAMARLEREPEAVVISFHGMPQRNVDLGDPYYQTLPGDLKVAARPARLAAGRLAHDLPITLRSRAMDRTRHHRSHRAPRQGRRAPSHRDRARLCRRLPGDVGRARHGKPRRLPGKRRGELSPTFPVSTTVRRGCP